MEAFPKPRPPLQATLLGEQVSDLMRQAIVSMELKPGQRLVERELVEWMGVSRATVRESLRQLAAEGLVKTIPQKGAVVAVPTRRETEELYEVRSMLEGLAARQFVERSSAAERRQLRLAFQRFQRIVDQGGDTRSMLAAKDAFYAVLFDGAKNGTIKGVIIGLQARITVLRSASMSQAGRPVEVVDEIRAIVEAVEAGDAELAEQACASHVRSAGWHCMAALANVDEEDEVGRR